MSDSVQPHRLQPIRLPCPWNSPGKNTGVGCHFLLQCMKAKSESKVSQSCPTLRDPMDCSLPGSSIHGILQARVLEWGAIAFSEEAYTRCKLKTMKGGFAAFFLMLHPCFLLLGKVIFSGGGKGKETLIALLLKLFNQFPNFRSMLHTLSCSSFVYKFWPASCSLSSFLGFATSRTIPSSKLLL